MSDLEVDLDGDDDDRRRRFTPGACITHPLPPLAASLLRANAAPVGGPVNPLAAAAGCVVAGHRPADGAGTETLSVASGWVVP